MQMIVISAILCGLAGGLGHLIGKQLSKFVSNPKLKTTILTSSIVITIFVGTIIFRKITPHIDNQVSKVTRSKYERVAMKHFAKLVKDERFSALIKGKSSQEVQNISKNLAASGMNLLQVDDLKEWNSLRLELANKNEILCTGFWTGSFDPQELLSTLNLLSESEIEKWALITIKASYLSLENKKPVKHSLEAVSASFNEIGNKLDPESKKIFLENFPKGLTLRNEDACWTMKTLMKTAPLLEEPHRSILLQSMARF